ncbi:hypothetical protein SPRG_04660 [Saprolegnia parasitica CBS 223.65]|uniref:PDZ domain-containing protein n=1 Tax=Saprolegnia parasitica (strain CBS 223.65) TaxID=695850 RepID=A0A067CJ62_SAPPC|nr:hypothetical protein SPRG_04660 [Saprolegnia parasitica CBS 223.65]KDO30759.1 hypothetical protein SPRG_04660 [Saprolegnia parasitica CBS 223.65]|eukprot:XP_012198458.1 hypothetical protein SPRG_04660 [Saprolegnia parasitica CBS 223.65]
MSTMVLASPAISSRTYAGEYDGPEHIIQYIWCGESLGLELHRDEATTPIVRHEWRQGPMGLILGLEYFSKQVIVKRVVDKSLPVKSGCVLLRVNGATVTPENHNELTMLMHNGHQSGATQVLEFAQCPKPVMVRSIHPGGSLEQAGVSDAYELHSINNIHTVYLSMARIESMLKEPTKPCYLTFALAKQPATHPGAMDVLVI